MPQQYPQEFRQDVVRVVGADAPVLRRLRVTDAEDLLAAFQSAPDMARQGAVTSLAQAHAYIAQLCGEGSSAEPWAIVFDGRVVGLVCVDVDSANRSGWFFYWMSNSTRGRGWTGRAAATVADWALTQRGLERLELGHRINNPSSGGVARKAGFVKEGVERGKFLIDGERIDVLTYGRLRTDPMPLYEPCEMIFDCPDE